MNDQDTICALATPAGGAVAVIRISGKETFGILNKFFSKDISSAQPYTIHYGQIVEHSAGRDNVIDDVLVSIFRAPHSYTGEESAEISCHGSYYITRRILQLLIDGGA